MLAFFAFEAWLESPAKEVMELRAKLAEEKLRTDYYKTMCEVLEANRHEQN